MKKFLRKFSPQLTGVAMMAVGVLTLITDYSSLVTSAAQGATFTVPTQSIRASAPVSQDLLVTNVNQTVPLTIHKGAGFTNNLVELAHGGTNKFVLPSTGLLPIAYGGTAAATANAGFNALSPVTTRGDLIVRNATVNARLPIGTVNQVLITDGTDPSWGQVSLTAGVTGALPIANGGSGQSAKTQAFDALSPLTTVGDILTFTGTNNARLAIGSANRLLRSDGTSASWAQATLTTDVTGVLPIANGGSGAATAAAAKTAFGIQAGTATTATDGTVTNTFSTAFSSAPVVVFTQIGNSPTNKLVSVTASNFVANVNEPSIVLHWIAVGPP